MGTGHVMRCLALAKVLKEKGADTEFICRKLEGNLIDKINLFGFNVHELEVSEEVDIDNKLAHSCWLGTTQQQDADDCIDVLKSNRIDWLIVDHYSLGEDWQKILNAYCNKIMVIDDLADRKHQCDILLDQTFGRQQEDYSALTPKDCRLLLGSQYALLRPEFAKWREYSLERRRESGLKKLLVNMGGVDVDNVTESILDELKTCYLQSDINITVVMGENAPHLENVKFKANTLPYKTEVRVNVDNMAEIMANADIAIGAAGSSTWERCCLGLPTIQVVIAKNQVIIAKSLAENNAIKFLQDIKKLSRVMGDVIDWMVDVSNIASTVTDGLGVKRVTSVLIDKKL